MQPFVTSRRFQISVFNGRADCGRDSSAPLFVRRGAGAFLSLVPHMREGSGAPKGAPSQVCTLRCRAPCDRHARLPALHRGDLLRSHRTSPPDRRTISSRYPGSISAAFHPMGPSHLRRPPHRGRAVTAPPGPWLRATDAGAAPCSVNQASLADALD